MLTTKQELILGNIRAPQCRVNNLYMCSDSRYRSQDHEPKLKDADAHFSFKGREVKKWRIRRLETDKTRPEVNPEVRNWHRAGDLKSRWKNFFSSVCPCSPHPHHIPLGSGPAFEHSNVRIRIETLPFLHHAVERKISPCYLRSENDIA